MEVPYLATRTGLLPAKVERLPLLWEKRREEIFIIEADVDPSYDELEIKHTIL